MKIGFKGTLYRADRNTLTVTEHPEGEVYEKGRVRYPANNPGTFSTEKIETLLHRYFEGKHWAKNWLAAQIEIKRSRVRSQLQKLDAQFEHVKNL